MSSCLTNPSRPKVASILLVIALNVRSLSSSRGGAGLDLRTSLPPNKDLSLLLLLPLLLLLGGRGLLLSLLRLGSELVLEEPNFGDPLDFEMDFDEPLELLILGNVEEDESVMDEGFFDEEGVEEDLTPVVDEELPVLLPLLEGILGRPGEDEDEEDEEEDEDDEEDEDWGFFEAGPLLTPGLRPVWPNLGEPEPDCEHDFIPEDEGEDLEEVSLALVLLIVSLIPSEPGLTIYSPGFLPESPGLLVPPMPFMSVPLVGVGIRSRLPFPPPPLESLLIIPDEPTVLAFKLLLLTVTAISSPVVCCDLSLSMTAEREFFLFLI